MDEEKVLSGVTDRNVTHLDNVDKALRGMLPAQRTMQRQRQQPGSRADGGMAQQGGIEELLRRIQQHESEMQNALDDARRLVDNFEDEQLRQENEIIELKVALEEERNKCALLQNRCEELKNVLRSAAEIMVNGEKKA